MIYEKAEVANEFNYFFTYVASKLVSKLPTSSGLYGSKGVNKYYVGLPGGAVVKGAVLQRQLCHQSPWVCAQALS